MNKKAKTAARNSKGSASTAKSSVGESLMSKTAEGIYALVIAGLIIWLTPLLEMINTWWKVGLSAALLALGFMTFAWSRGIISKRLAQIMSGLIVGAVVVGALFQIPTKGESFADDLFQVCDDPMWGTQRVTCPDASREYIAQNYEDYGLDNWNTYDPGFEARSVPLVDIVAGGPHMQAVPLRSIGQVVAVQPMGDLDLVVQLRPPTSDVIESVGDVSGFLPNGESAGQVLAPSHDKTDDSADHLLYLSVTARHFFTPVPGQLLIFDGVLVATGRTYQVGSDREVPMSYVRAHSVEHVVEVRE